MQVLNSKNFLLKWCVRELYKSYIKISSDNLSYWVNIVL